MERERDRSLSVVDEDDLNKEDYNFEMGEGEKRLKHIYNSKSEFPKVPSKPCFRIKSLENFSKKGSLKNVLKKEASLNTANKRDLSSGVLIINKKEKEGNGPSEIANKHEIIWDYTVEGWNVKPFIDVEIGSNDFASSCLQFFLWAPKEDEKDKEKGSFASIKRVENLKDLMEEDSDEEKSVNVHVNHVKLIGECYININKLFKDNILAVYFKI